MIRVERTEGRESLHHEGRDFTLISWTWTIAIAARRFTLGWRYSQPSRVESNEESVSIFDYVMAARVAAALILVAGAFVRRSRR